MAVTKVKRKAQAVDRQAFENRFPQWILIWRCIVSAETMRWVAFSQVDLQDVRRVYEAEGLLRGRRALLLNKISALHINHACLAGPPKIVQPKTYFPLTPYVVRVPVTVNRFANTGCTVVGGQIKLGALGMLDDIYSN